MTEACIVGWAHSPFGKLEDPDIESLIGRVAGAAIADAGIAPHEIDSTFLSLFNNGFSAQDFPASLVLQHVPDLRFKPITRFENACASGSAAVYGARYILLDDINVFYGHQFHETLTRDRDYALIEFNPAHRNGYAIFRKAPERRRDLGDTAACAQAGSQRESERG